MHSHLLPGVDDGVQSADDMQAALNAMQEAGVERVFLTPHVMADLPDNRRSYLQDRFACMKQFAPEGIELGWRRSICWTPVSVCRWRTAS